MINPSVIVDDLDIPRSLSRRWWSGGYPGFRAGGTIGAPALVRRPAASLTAGPRQAAG